MLEITKLLDKRDLCSFALANSFCNDLANRQLWRTYRIGGRSRLELIERCNALLRVPRRAAYILRLIIGPCIWTWDADLIAKFSQVWQSVPRLLDLFLEAQKYPRHCGTVMYRIGGDFNPLMRGLIEQSARLRLRVFGWDSWLRPDSLLLQFLASQPSIRELIGVDVFRARLPSLPSNFLPALEVLICHVPATAELFCPSRPINTLEVRDASEYQYDFGLLVDALSKCPGTLVDVSIQVFKQEDVVRVLGCLPKIRYLCLWGFQHNNRLSFPVKLPMLEEMIGRSRYDAIDPVDVNRLGAQLGPHVRRISLFSTDWFRIWQKGNGDGYVGFDSQS